MAAYCYSDSLLRLTRGVLGTIAACAILAALSLSCTSEPKEQTPGLAPGQFKADSFLPGSLPGITLQKMSVRKTEPEIESYMGSRAADYYEYHLIGLVAAIYDADTNRLSVEIAQFVSPLDAYGFYAMTRPETVQMTRLGAEGYMEGHSFYYVMGPYAVTISAMNEAEGVSDLVQRLAVSISAEIGLDGSLPTEFSVFPATDRVPASFEYIPRNFMSLARIDSVLTCRYQVDSATCTIFITGDRSGKKYLALSQYADSLGVSNPAPETIGFDDDYGVTFEDPSHGTVMAGLVAGQLVGVLNYAPAKHQALLHSWVELLRGK